MTFRLKHGPGRRQPAAGARTSILSPAGIAVWTAAAAGVVSLAATVGWIADLATRPPCPPGYVRLVDVEQVAPWLSGAVVVISVAALLAALRYRQGRVLMVVGVALLLLSMADTASVVTTIIGHRSAVADDCWTF